MFQNVSDCCGAVVRFQDICSACGEHCEVISSDDGYDAARDAYDNGYGSPVNRRQIQEQKDWADECRHNGW